MDVQAPSPSVAERLKLPALLLLVIGIGTVLYGAWSLFSGVLGVGLEAQKQLFPGLEGLVESLRSISIATGVVQLVTGTLTFLGGLALLRQRGRVLALTAAILALSPGLNCCCLLSLPVGVWALVLLLDPQVKAAFQGPPAS